jgi:hypothetical protein
VARWDKKYIVTEPSSKGSLKAPWIPDLEALAYGKDCLQILAIDSEARKGAFYFEVAWYWPGKWPKSEAAAVKEHTHPFDEILGFFGSENRSDPYDLGGEVELWIDGKQNILNRSFMAYIPAGIKHCPLKILKVDRPILHFSGGPSTEYNVK